MNTTHCSFTISTQIQLISLIRIHSYKWYRYSLLQHSNVPANRPLMKVLQIHQLFACCCCMRVFAFLFLFERLGLPLVDFHLFHLELEWRAIKISHVRVCIWFWSLSYHFHPFVYACKVAVTRSHPIPFTLNLYFLLGTSYWLPLSRTLGYPSSAVLWLPL